MLLPLIYLSFLIALLTFLTIFISSQILSWILYNIKLKSQPYNSISIQKYGNTYLYTLYQQKLDLALVQLYNITHSSDQLLCINNAYYNIALIYLKANNKNLAQFYYNKILNTNTNNILVSKKLKNIN